MRYKTSQLRIILRWRHNGRDSVSNHQPHDCLLNRLFRRRSKKASKRRVTGLCAGNSPGTGGFPSQMASNAENVSIWWRHHDIPFVRGTDDRWIPPRKGPAMQKTFPLHDVSAYRKVLQKPSWQDVIQIWSNRVFGPLVHSDYHQWHHDDIGLHI